MICVDGRTARRRGFNAFFAFVRTGADASSRLATAVSDPRIPFRFALCFAGAVPCSSRASRRFGLSLSRDERSSCDKTGWGTRQLCPSCRRKTPVRSAPHRQNRARNLKEKRDIRFVGGRVVVRVVGKGRGASGSRTQTGDTHSYTILKITSRAERSLACSCGEMRGRRPVGSNPRIRI